VGQEKEEQSLVFSHPQVVEISQIDFPFEVIVESLFVVGLLLLFEMKDLGLVVVAR